MNLITHGVVSLRVTKYLKSSSWLLLVIVGTVGNTLVITSILLEKKRIYQNGNMFIVNLAVADLIVSIYPSTHKQK